MAFTNIKKEGRLLEVSRGASTNQGERSPFVLERLKALFEAEKIPYRLISHREAYTASEVAESIHMPGRKFVKVVIVQANGKKVMAVLPSHRRVNLSLFAEVAGKETVSLMEEDEFRLQFPDCEVGAMPPFGTFYQLPVYADALLGREAVIYFRAGSHREVIEMRHQDFIRLAKPSVCHFVQEPLKRVSGF